jgi:hypothetical protein
VRARLDVELAFEGAGTGVRWALARGETFGNRLTHGSRDGVGKVVLPGREDSVWQRSSHSLDLLSHTAGKDEWEMAGALARSQAEAELAPVGGEPDASGGSAMTWYPARRRSRARAAASSWFQQISRMVFFEG